MGAGSIDAERIHGHRRCRLCGSRHLKLTWNEPALPEDVPPVAGGSGPIPDPVAETHMRWRCRRCRTTMRYQGQEASLWQRRRPLANWLFSSRG
jgi:hypothetical protein